MAYVKVAVKKKTGPKPKVKPIDAVSLLTKEERFDRLKEACFKLIKQFKKNDLNLKQTHTASSKIRAYSLEEMKSKGLNTEYFRMVSLKADGMDVNSFIEMIPVDERPLYIKYKHLVNQYIIDIKDSGVAMVDKANVVRDLIKDVKKYDPKGKVAKVLIDYYRKVYNAECELIDALSEMDVNIEEANKEYSFIKEIYED